MPSACVEGHSLSQGGGQITSGRWNCLRVNCGYVSANTVRYIYNGKLKMLLLLLLRTLAIITPSPQGVIRRS